MAGYACFAVEGDRRQVSPTYPTVAEATAWRAGRGAHRLDVLPVTVDEIREHIGEVIADADADYPAGPYTAADVRAARQALELLG
jgi:hypothetical protein